MQSTKLSCFWILAFSFGSISCTYTCRSDDQLGSVDASGKKGLNLDDDTFRWCSGQIVDLWPNTEAPVTSFRLFKAWDDTWDASTRHQAWSNLKERLVSSGGKVFMGTPVGCDEAGDERQWTFTKELLAFLAPEQVMGLAIGNELELLRIQVSHACAQKIWDEGYLWARFQKIVSEFNDLGFGHLPVTSVFTSMALGGSPFYEQPGARVKSFLRNATAAYGDRFAFTINYYPFWDPNAWLDAGTTNKCSGSIAWGTSFEQSGSVPGALRNTRKKMRQLTGSDSNLLWIGETGWSTPAPEDFSLPVADCPAWTSKETLREYYKNFLAWDLAIGEDAQAPDHVFYFSMRDSWNFGKREGFGLIEGCNAIECKIRSEGYRAVTLEQWRRGSSFCEDGLLSEYYPFPPEQGEKDCEARCLVDPACKYMSYWRSNWCRLTSSCNSFGTASNHSITIYQKLEHSQAPTPAPAPAPAPSDSHVVGDGWCRYGSDERDWIRALTSEGVDECQKTCQAEEGCTSYSFTPGVSGNCFLYRGGPYTYGNGRANTVCYRLQAPTPAPTQAPDNAHVVGEGWCRYGADSRDVIRSLPSSDVGACQSACQAEQACTYFGYTPGSCYLYSGGPYTKGNGRANTVCYRLQAPTSAPTQAPSSAHIVGEGWCRYGANGRDVIRAFRSSDVGGCQSTCHAEQGCTYFAYTPGVSDSCYLYRGGPYTKGNGRANTLCYRLPAVGNLRR